MYLIVSTKALTCTKVTANLYSSEIPISDERFVFKTQKVKKAKSKRFPEGVIILSYDLTHNFISKPLQRKIFHSLGVRIFPSIYVFPYATQENVVTVDELKEYLEDHGTVYRSPVVVPLDDSLLRETVYKYHRNAARKIVYKVKKYEQNENFSKKRLSELKSNVKLLKKRCMWYTQRGVTLKNVYNRAYKAVLAYRHMTEQRITI